MSFCHLVKGLLGATRDGENTLLQKKLTIKKKEKEKASLLKLPLLFMLGSKP